MGWPLVQPQPAKVVHDAVSPTRLSRLLQKITVKWGKQPPYERAPALGCCWPNASWVVSGMAGYAGEVVASVAWAIGDSDLLRGHLVAAASLDGSGTLVRRVQT